MKNKKGLLAVLLCLVAFAGVFVWLYWGSIIPNPSQKEKDGITITPKVKNSVISRQENGKKLWEFVVGEAESVNDNEVNFKDIKGKVYLKDGGVMLGAPLGTQKQRTSSSIGLGISIIVIFIYYAIIAFTSGLGRGGVIYPWLAAMLPNLACMLVGLFLLKQKNY